MPLIQRGGKATIVNTEANPVHIDPNDALPLHLMDITTERIDNTKYDRNTWFGSNLSVDATERILSPTATTVGLEVTFPASAVNLSIASTSTSDTGAGTGAQTLIVRGLDASYNEQDEEITLTGQTPVDTIATFIRVNDLFVKNAGSGGFNVGNIYCSDSADTFTLGVPQTRLYMAMEIGDNISKTAVFTPTLNVTQWYSAWLYIQTTATISNPMIVRMYKNNARIDGNTFHLREKFYLQGSEQIDMSHNTFLEGGEDMYITVEKTGGGANPEIHLKMFAIEKLT